MAGCLKFAQGLAIINIKEAASNLRPNGTPLHRPVRDGRLSSEAVGAVLGGRQLGGRRPDPQPGSPKPPHQGQQSNARAHHGKSTYCLNDDIANTPKCVQTNLIDICVANNSAQHIKDNLNHFRNTCQHQSMSLLESVINYLIKKNNQVIKQIEQ